MKKIWMALFIGLMASMSLASANTYYYAPSYDSYGYADAGRRYENYERDYEFTRTEDYDRTYRSDYNSQGSCYYGCTGASSSYTDSEHYSNTERISESVRYDNYESFDSRYDNRYYAPSGYYGAYAGSYGNYYRGHVPFDQAVGRTYDYRNRHIKDHYDIYGYYRGRSYRPVGYRRY